MESDSDLISKLISCSSIGKQRQGCAAVRRLPGSILRDISEFLPIPSQAMMAAAFSRSECFNSDTLDFDVINARLASKLTDDDITSILVSIDAVNRLKVLKLEGCSDITGTGLTPIMFSVVLEQIDLNTSYYASVASSASLFCSNFPFHFMLEEDVVIPILDSIVGVKGSALKHVELPIVWRENKSTKLTNFFYRFGEALSNRTCNCVECKDDFTVRYWVNSTKSSSDWGLQYYTCYDCTKNICGECEPGFCHHCKKQFCGNCRENFRCEDCSYLVCEGCDDTRTCEQCGNNYCEDCAPILLCECCYQSRCINCVDHNYCAECEDSNCGECSNQDNVQWCEICEEAHCNDCRLGLWHAGHLNCLGCRGLLFPRIMRENNALKTENMRMKDVAQKILDKLAPLADDPEALLQHGSGNDMDQDDPL